MEMTVGAAARQTGWSARMLRYLEETGLVVPATARRGLPLYGTRELNQLRSLRELRRVFGVELTDLAFAARLRREPGLRDAVHTWLAGGDERARVGAAQARAAPRRLIDRTDREEPMATTKRFDVKDLALRPRGCGASSGPTGRCRCWPRSGSDSSARSRSAATGSSACLHVTTETANLVADAEGRRRGRRALRIEPAVHPGRRRGGARRRVRHRHLRDQGRGQRQLLLAHRGGRRPQAAADDGRRRRRDRRAPLRPARAARATSSPAPRRRPPASSG